MKFKTGTQAIAKDPVWLDEEIPGFVAKQKGNRFIIKLNRPFRRTNPRSSWLEVDRDFAEQVVREI